MTGKPNPGTAAGPSDPRAPSPAAAMLQQAIAHHRAGRLREAEALYRQILATQPQPDALNLLGLLRYQRGDAEEAVALIDRALAITRRVPDYHNNRGMALNRLGRRDEAVASFRKAIMLRPSYPEAQYNLGNALRELGDKAAAAVAYRAALKLRPDLADAHMNLGNLLAEGDAAAEGLAHLERAVALKPNSGAALANLGAALLRAGRLDEAEPRLRQALALQPDLVEARYRLARIAFARQDYPAAEQHCRAVLAQRPDHREARLRLGRALAKAGRAQEALAELEVAAARPGDAEALYLLGRACDALDALPRAADAYRRALAADPAHRDARSCLIELLVLFGDIEAALAETARAAEGGAEALEAVSSHVMVMNYAPEIGADELAARHRAAGRLFEGKHAPLPLGRGDRDGERLLRVGYVSSDLHRHSCAYFFEPLLAAHDPAAVAAFCYATGSRTDAVTERLRHAAHAWREVASASDREIARQVQADGIDILVDLNGHTAGNRLGLFAMKPAPIQMTWLGYPNTTGLTRMDYRLTDRWVDPEGAADGRHTEALVRLARPFLCYRAPAEATAVAAPPAGRTGRVTFGSFNNIAKVGPAVVALWAGLLRELPDAVLMLKSKGLAADEVRRTLRARFAEHGIAPERVGLYPMAAKSEDAFQAYDAIDIALDPFPYNGTTTTCEALWMGVPVVTLEGDRHAARVGSTLLRAVGLDELVATTPEDYRRRAVALAGDLPRLAALRQALRPRMAASPLCDAGGFARAVERAYRDVWRRWCAAEPGAAGAGS